MPVEVRGAALEKAPQIFERQRQRVLGLGIAVLAAQKLARRDNLRAAVQLRWLVHRVAGPTPIFFLSSALIGPAPR